MKLTKAQIEELETQSILVDTRSEWLDVIQDIVGCTRADARQIDEAMRAILKEEKCR